MIEDIALIVVRCMGGFWKFRSRMVQLRRRSLQLKLMRAIYYAYLNRYGAYIGHSAQFDSEPCFPHNLHGIFIAGNAKIGRNCVIFQQVTLGANAIPTSKGVGCPTIGDNVYIGAGAKIIGRVTIGDHCRIGANCVVTTDVASNSIVVLPPPRMNSRDDRQDNRYFRWSADGPMYFEDGAWILETDPETIARLRNAF